MCMVAGSKPVRTAIIVMSLPYIVLVLLIIFMVITPMLQRGKPVVLPDAKVVSPLKGGDPIFLSVTKDGKVWLDKDEIAKDDIPRMLQAQMQAMPGAPILLKGDRELDYRVIRQVVLEVSKTHVLGMSLAASQRKEKD